MSEAEHLCQEMYKDWDLSGHCKAVFDGLLCWRPTPWNTLAIQPCLSELRGIRYDDTQNASRLCLADGQWNISIYDNCTEKPPDTSTTDVSSLIYVAGYSLSLVVLALAVFIFLYFKDLRCLRNTIHTNLMTTYILSACSWIINLLFIQNRTQEQATSCMLLVICMHYFYLTNFFWMLVEGLYLYMLVVETFTAENIKLKVYILIGWGLPAVFIIIWVIARCLVADDLVSGLDELSLEGVERGVVCVWIQEHHVDWIHKAPELAALALNLFFLVRIMWVLITKLRSANTVETEQYRKASKALLVLIPLLGITYLLLLYIPNDESVFAKVFNYTRALILSTQGFPVALFYCFMNTEVRHAIRYHVERWKTGRTIGGGRRRGASYSKDWSPRSRTESIRLYHHPSKRESAASETTTTTLLVPRMSLAPLHDGRHLHADYITGGGSASGDQSPV